MIDSLSRGVDCQLQFLLITRARVIIIQFPTNRYNKISITLVLRDIVVRGPYVAPIDLTMK